MNSSSTQTRRHTDNRRFKRASNVLAWVAVIILALVPFPWGW